MIIAPKLDTKHHTIPSWVSTVYEGAVEVQMLTLDFDEELRRILELIRVLPPTDTLLVHLPFGVHNFSTYLVSRSWRYKLQQFMFGLDFVKDVRVVMHVETAWDTLANLDWEEALTEICAEGWPSTILLENAMISPNRKDLTVPDVAHVLAHVRDVKNVRGLVDLTHLNASYYCTKERVVYPPEAMEPVTSYHIAAALDMDGWHDKRTHGRRHKNYTALSGELDTLFQQYPVSESTVLVAEVSEEDYSRRLDQYQEILWLRRYREDAGL